MQGAQYPIYTDDEKEMQQKAHGTCDKPVMDNLKFGCDFDTADRICCFNRHYAEHSGYAFGGQRSWLAELAKTGDTPVTYYDSVTGKPLFEAPKGRTVQ